MFVNLTQHVATPEQVSAGVVYLSLEERRELVGLLNFVTVPDISEIEERAAAIAEIASSVGATRAMIGGAPYLMSALERHLRRVGVAPCYAFSVRDSVEKVLPDGSVSKTNVFRHVGFVDAP